MRGNIKPDRLAHSAFAAFCVFYGFGGYLADVAGNHAHVIGKPEPDPWYWVAPWYGLAACLVFVVFLAALTLGRQRFSRSYDAKNWQTEIEKSSLTSFFWLVLPAALVFLSQLLLMILVQENRDSILWTVSFTVLSSALIALGAYFLVGYPGMVSLERLEEWLGHHRRTGETMTDLPKGLMSSLEAELAMLRILVGGLVSLNVVGTVTILLSLDKVASLFNEDEFLQVSLPDRIWFACGAALLFATCHVLVTGPVHGHYSRIVRWLRHADGAE